MRIGIVRKICTLVLFIFLCLIMTLPNGTPEFTVCYTKAFPFFQGLKLCIQQAKVSVMSSLLVKENHSDSFSTGWKLSTDTSSLVGSHRHCCGAGESRSQFKSTGQGRISHSCSSESIVVILTVPTQNGDSAVIVASVKQQPDTLRELVRAGSDLNLQNQVRYTVTVDTAPHIIPSCPY